MTIGIDADVGCIRSVDCELGSSASREVEREVRREMRVAQSVLDRIKRSYSGAVRVDGLPAVDTSEFTVLRQYDPEPEIVETNGLGVVVAGSSLYVVFNMIQEPETCYYRDRVGFFVSAGFLCGIGFFGLTDAQVAALGRGYW